jgi:hypothetical protein
LLLPLSFYAERFGFGLVNADIFGVIADNGIKTIADAGDVFYS